MKKLNLTLILVLSILGFYLPSNAQLITIPSSNPSATGLSNNIQRKPFGSYYGYERTALIYSNAEIGGIGIINSIGFFVESTNSPATSTPVNIYLKVVADSTFTASTDFSTEVSGATLVYSGNILASNLITGSWITTALSSPFLYTGSGHLEVLVETNATGTGSEFSGTGKLFRMNNATTNNQLQYWQRDNTPPTSTDLGFLSSNRTNIQLNLVPATACSGRPTAGTLTSSSSLACPGTNINLSLSGTSMVTGLTYQWISSTNGSAYSVLSGVTTSSYSYNLVDSGYYKCIVTCTASGLSDTTNVVFVAKNPFTQCYCTSNLGGSCGTGNDITNVTILSTTLNNSPTCSGAGSNVYTVFPASGSTTASLMQANTYSLSTTFSGTSNGSVWIDLNHDGIFDASEWTQLTAGGTSAIVSILIPGNAMLGNTMMRIRSNYSFSQNIATDACTQFFDGETQDYIITILPGVPCAAKPTAGVASVSDSSVCPGTSISFSLAGTSATTGLTYQWLGSNNGTTYSVLSGDTTPSFSMNFVDSGYYKCVVTCTASGLSDTSNIVFVAKAPRINCYCSVGIGGSCGGNDITSVQILSTTLNASPSCNSTSNFDSYTLNAITPTTTATLMVGSSYTLNTTFSGSSIASVWFDYNQNGVFDSIEWIQITTSSTSGSNLFTVPTTALTGQTLMRIRSRAVTPNGAIDACTGFGSGETQDFIITIVAASTCAAPTALSATSITQTSASLNWTENGTATMWQGEMGPSGFALGSGVRQVTTSKPFTATPLMANTAYSYYVRAICGAGDTSAWAGPYTFTTLANVCAAPTALTATSITQTSASLNWTENGTATMWQGEMGPSGFALGSGVRQITTSKPFTATPLMANTAYSYYVRAICGAGDTSAWAGPYSFTTLANVCAAPTSLTATSITQTSASLNWTENGTATMWQGEMGPSGFALGSGVRQITTSKPFTATPLMANTAYSYYVRSICGAGDTSAWAGPYSFTTLANVVTVHDMAATSVILPTSTPLCGNATTPVSIIVLNNGNVTETNVPVSVWVNNAGTISNLTGVITSISAGSSSTLNLGNLNTLNGGLVQVKGIVSLSTDGNHSNDSTTIFSITYSPYPAQTNSITSVNCFGNSTGAINMTLTGGTSFTSHWSNGMTTEDLTATASGSYSDTVTNSAGCKSVFGPFNITQPSAALSMTSVITNQIQNGSKGTITSTISGGTAPYTFLWNTSATTKDLTNLTAGNYSQTVTDANGCQVQKNDTVKLILTGINEIQDINLFAISPNPSSGKIIVSVELNEVSPLTLEIYSTDGKLILTSKNENNLRHSFSADLSDYAAGLYFVKAVTNHSILTKRLIISK